MNAIKTILLPVEMSAITNVMIAKAAFIAKQYNAKILPLHVIDMHFDYPAFPYQQENKVRERINQWMVGVRDRLIAAGAIVGPNIIRNGVPHQIIKWASHEMDVDLIILGARRKSAVEKIFGSTAESVIRSVAQPVWLVHPQESQENIKAENVLCAIDCSKNSHQTVESAIAICRSFNASIDILHISPMTRSRLVFDPDLNLFSKHHSPIPEKAFNKEMVEEKKLEIYLEQFDFSGIAMRSMIVQGGNPAEEICKSINSNRYDLLVLGASDSSKLLRVFQSGTADNLLRKVSCSIVTVFHQQKGTKGIQSSKKHIAVM